MIPKRCDMHDIEITKRKAVHGKNTPREYSKKISTVSNVSEAKMLVKRENPPRQK